MDVNLDDETLQIFLEESHEHLEGIESDLLQIEDAGADADEEQVNKVFRAVHSVKGGAGFFGFDKVKDLAHAMESLLGLIRKKEMVPTSNVIGILLDSADVLSGMINDPPSMESVDISQKLVDLKNILTGSLPEDKKETVDKMIDVSLPGGKSLFSVSAFSINQAQNAEKGGDNVFLLEFDLINDIARKDKTPWDVISELLQLTAFIDSKVDISTVGTLESHENTTAIPFYALLATNMEAGLVEDFLELDANSIHRISVEDAKPAKEAHRQTKEAIVQDESPTYEPEVEVESEVEATTQPEPELEPEPMAEAAPEAKDQDQTKQKSPGTKSTPETSIRVNVKVIDTLMTLAGELVLARNQLVQSVVSRSEQAFEHASQRVDLVTTELQDAIMTTRMQSISIVFNKFQRVVRDLSRDLGKKVKLVLEGEEVELDKTIIEAIGDPLTHLVRNAVDHGVETVEKRKKAGKPEMGTIRLSAEHKAGQVVIEIADDGAGIDPAKIREKAISMGLHTPAQLDEMSDKALARLIFKPGFSTAEKVTDVSGRGVGMDVVHSNLSKVGGVVDLDSTKGHGSTIRITLPLTLAIIPSLLISSGREKFAIPQVNLVELVRISAKEAHEKIEKIGEALITRLRGELLPLVDLRQVLDMDGQVGAGVVSEPAAMIAAASEVGADAMNIAVVAAGDFHYGLIVESLLDSAEIVVKPLGNHLRHCRTYAGATILGDGHVALILDVFGISQRIRSSAMEAVEKELSQSDQAEMDQRNESKTLLIIGNGHNERFAIPLGLVERIEKIKDKQIEAIGGRRVLKYRGGTLPLFAIEDVAQVTPREETGTLYVIVFRASGREAGLMASQIYDITTINLAVDEVTYRQPGIFGSVILQEEITLLVDPQSIVSQMMPELVVESEPEPVSQTAVKKKFTVLVVEDSKFFLNQIKNFVEEAGYEVLVAEDGQDALNVLEEHSDKIDLVLTDIEMPELDGFDLTRRMRQDDRFKSIPVIAVTSVMGDEAVAKGRKVGIDEYLVKLDRDQILERSKHYLENGRPI